MQKFNYSLVLLLLVLWGTSSCKSKKDIVTKNLPSKSAQKLLEEIEENTLNYEWITLRASVTASINKSTQSFKANVRVKKDSVVWVSILPALGIEAARLMLTPDSVFFVDKINARYFAGDYRFFKDKFNLEVDYYLFQDLIDATPLDYDKDAVYTLTTDENYYILSTVGARKLRKALSVKEKNIEKLEVDTALSTLYNPRKERKLERALKKLDEESLYLRKYKISGKDARLTGSFLNDLSNLFLLEITYKNYQPTEDGAFVFPTDADLFLSNSENEINIKLSFSKVKINQAQPVKFNIPARYEPIK
ncbi:MAG: DUF4292 domain-containing protein [Luteibaculaceae bacterium]